MSFPEWEKVKRTHSDSRNALIELAAALTRDARDFTTGSNDLVRISSDVRALAYKQPREVQVAVPLLADQIYQWSLKLSRLAAKYGVSL